MVTERESKVSELPIGREVQFSVGEMSARYFGGILHNSPKEDKDEVIVKGRRVVWAFEAKMGEITRGEASDGLKKVGGASEKVGFVSLRGRPPDGYGDLSLGPEDLIRIAEELSKREVIFSQDGGG